MRVYAETVYGIPPEQVVGSSIADQVRDQGRQARADARAEGLLHRRRRRQGRSASTCSSASGRRCAFGNSDGDREMLEWTTAGDGAAAECWSCTTTPSASTPTAPPTACPTPRSAPSRQALMDEAKKRRLDGDQHEERLEADLPRDGQQ